MNFSLALSGSIAGDFLLAALVLAFLKVASAVIQFSLMRGDYRTTPKTGFFRAVYFTGKVTPSLALACVCVTAILQHNGARSWLYGALAVLVALLALFVVQLRRQGRFFGLLDMLTRKRE